MTRAMAELPSGAVPAQTHIQSIDERAARGRALRALQPREQQAIWKAPTNRRDPVEILEDEAQIVRRIFHWMSLSIFSCSLIIPAMSA